MPVDDDFDGGGATGFVERLAEFVVGPGVDSDLIGE
jgi:hypothetical protein